MSALVVEVDGRVLRLEGKSVYRIGRAIEADVVLTAGSVSRQHAELQSSEYGWVLVDAGSQFGTYVDDERVTDYPIEQRISVRCGPPAAGASLTIVPAEQYDDAVTPEVPAPVPPMAPPLAAPPPPPMPAPGPPSRIPPMPSLPDELTMPPMSSAPPPDPSARFAPPGARPAAAPGLPPSIPGNDATQVLAAAPRPPAGPPGVAGPPPQRTGPDLLLVAEGREHRFRHPTPITVGRRSDSTVVISDPACSRVHGRIDPFPGGWTYTNLSNEGSYAEGRRVTTVRFDERISLRLGHPVAGPELTLVPILSAAEEEKRIARRRWGKRLVIIGAIAAAVLLIGGILGAALLISRDGDDDPRADGNPSSDGNGSTPDELTESERDAAKAAVVKITAQSYRLNDPSRTPVDYGGSGSIIRKDGLILTNAHVASPESDGLVEQYGPDAAIADPEFLLISITDGMKDTTSVPLYRARVVEADGNLDVAVVQIYANADGSDLDRELDLPTIPLGDSSSLRSGDDVAVVGFPGVAMSENTVTLTRGGIATIVQDPSGETVVEFDTTARISPGNSGGMAVDNDGQLIGVPTSIFSDGSVISGRIRAIDVVKDLIEQAEAETG